MDLATGQDLEQHKMLKKLFHRSGLKRDEWHNASEMLAGRTLGSPTKLSDIFRGEHRSLPMRDITPYIQALGLKKSETDYYISEFFKAYCDDNLHQYISKKTGGKEALALRLRISILENRLSDVSGSLKKRNYRDGKNFKKKEDLDVPPKDKKLERYKSPLVEANQLLKKTSDMLIDRGLTGQELIKELWSLSEDGRFENQGDLLDYEKFENNFEPVFEIIKENSNLYMAQVTNWFLVIRIILSRPHNDKFLDFIRVFIPENALNDLAMIKSATDKEACIPSFRTSHEVSMHLFSEFKESHPKAFEKGMSSSIKINSSSIEERMNVFDQPLQSFELSDFDNENDRCVVPIIQEIDFQSFVDSRKAILFNIPAELSGCINLASPNTFPEEYNRYIDFISFGMSNRVSVGQMYYLQNPFINKDELKNKRNLEVISERLKQHIEFISSFHGISSPIKKYTEANHYPYSLGDIVCIEEDNSVFLDALYISMSMDSYS
jgi:hypothetical protein